MPFLYTLLFFVLAVPNIFWFVFLVMNNRLRKINACWFQSVFHFLLLGGAYIFFVVFLTLAIFVSVVFIEDLFESNPLIGIPK